MEMLDIDFTQLFQNGIEFGNDFSEVKDDLIWKNDTLSLQYLTILSSILTPSYFSIAIITVFTFLAIPANILTVFTIILKKDLWTPCNAVLSINGLVQATGSFIYLITRSLWFYSFIFLPMNKNYKESVYAAGWWTYCLMMRTGNNR